MVRGERPGCGTGSGGGQEHGSPVPVLYGAAGVHRVAAGFPAAWLHHGCKAADREREAGPGGGCTTNLWYGGPWGRAAGHDAGRAGPGRERRDRLYHGCTTNCPYDRGVVRVLEGPWLTGRRAGGTG